MPTAGSATSSSMPGSASSSAMFSPPVSIFSAYLSALLDMAFYEPFSWLLLVFFVLQFLGSIVRTVARKMDDMALFEAARVAFLASCELDSAHKSAPKSAVQKSAVRTVETVTAAADPAKRKRKKGKRTPPPLASPDADGGTGNSRSTPASTLLSKAPSENEAARVEPGHVSKTDSLKHALKPQSLIRGASELVNVGADVISAHGKSGKQADEDCGFQHMLHTLSERSDLSRLSLVSTVPFLR